MFLDRGMHDIFGFSQQIEYRLDAEELFQIQNQNYDLCIMPAPLEEKFYDQNSVRRQNYQESLIHHKGCTDFYISYFQARKIDTEKHLIFVPAGDMEFRVDFVLKIISFFVHNKKRDFDFYT